MYDGFWYWKKRTPRPETHASPSLPTIKCLRRAAATMRPYLKRDIRNIIEMPKLARLRFVSIGHTNARMQDLTLNFCDQSNLPSDSTLWLRNGGGKSSILSLFFAMLRPNRRDFLGTRADGGERRLEQYILKTDRSVVAAEWVLDDPSLQGMETGTETRFLTGVFYEYSATKADTLNRLFFCARIYAGVEETQINGIPIDTLNAVGTRVRRTLTSFKQKWHELSATYPQLRIESTDNQSTWSELLQREGIDPGLFGYQLTMNMREGGADELFRFKTPEDFVDFLLQLSVEQGRADDISSNLETFREQLRRRKHEFLPDLDLSNGLIERLTPLVELHDKRLKTQAEAKSLSQLTTQLKQSIAVSDKSFGAEIERLESAYQETLQEKDRQDTYIHAHKGYAAAMAFMLSEREKKRNERLVEDIREELDKAKLQVTLWNAAYPYRNWEIALHDVEALKLQVSGKEAQKAPLIETLEQVASDYVAALSHQSRRLRSLQQEKHEASEDREAESRSILEDASKCDVAVTGLEAEAKSYRLHIEKRDAQFAKLLNLQVIYPHETPQDALERLEKTRDALKQKLRSSQNRRSGDTDMMDALERQKDELTRDLATHRADLKSVQAELERATEARDSLESDANLLQCLEVDTIVADDLSDDTATLLTRRASEVGERCARLRTESAALERARVHLLDHGLMPPSIEVEELLHFLNEKTTAESGWAYIHAHMPGDALTKRRLVETYPAVAQGIIVPAAEFERVRQILRAEPARLPQIPVVIATPSVFDTPAPSSSALFVAGPKNDAWFDRHAAEAELATLEEKVSALQREIDKHTAMQQNYTKAAMRFTQFRTLYPRGVFQSFRARLTQLKITVEDEEARLQDVMDDLRRYKEKQRNDTSVEQQYERDIANVNTMLERIHEFLNEDDSGLETWQREIDRCLALARKQRETAEELRARAEEVSEEARRIRKQGEPYAEEARLLENERANVRYVKTPPTPKAGALDALRSRYHALCTQVEQELGNEEWMRRLKEAEESAKKTKREFERCLRDGLTLEVVKNAVAQLSDPNDIDVNRERAEELTRVLSTRSAEANRIQGEKNAEWKQRQQAWVGFGKPTLPAELEADISAEAMARMEDAVQGAIATMRQLERQVIEIQRKISENKHGRTALQKDLDRLQSVQRSYADFFNKIEPETDSDFVPIAIPEISQTISTLEERLSAYQQVHSTLDTSRKSLVSAVRRWAENDAFSALQSRITAQFKGLDPETLEAQASEYRDQLTLRVKQLEETLSDIDAHRMILAKLLLTAAGEGLRLLKLADAASTVPAEVPNVGGERFLRITTKEPPSQKEKLDLIQELVDAIVDEPTLPTGIKLIQRAVRKLASPFSIRVLNPATNAAQHYIEITQTARFSGGEQMTCAILLYCTLANVRARTRGMNRQPTSVLLLDNPVGRASRVSFIHMQRQFASAMGIQLIYTTGLHDLDALGVIPNVIRLRNELIDRLRNHHLIENEEAMTTRIDAMRISRFDDVSPGQNNTSNDGTKHHSATEDRDNVQDT